MSASPVLYIVCPTQKRGFAAFMSACFVGVVATGLARGWQRDLSSHLLVYTACAVVIVALAACALYRNFVFRDELYIAREGRLPPSIELAFMAHEVRAVRLLPAPDAWTPEGKWEMLGFGQGRIEIDTATHRYRFGAGLGEYESEAALTRILGFCQEPHGLAAA